MIGTFVEVFKNKDIRKKILFTLGMLLIYRLGAAIVVPGIDSSLINLSGNSLLGMMSLLGGGAISHMSIFALGVGPYITASIIIQLLSMDVIPYLTDLAKEGKKGQQEIDKITRYSSVVMAMVQSFFIVQTLQAQYKPPTNRRITVAFGGQFDPMLTHIARQWSRRERTRIIAITHHPENLTNAYDDIIIPRINAATFDDSLLQKIDIAYFFALSPPQQSPDYEAVAEDLMLATASAFVHAATRSPQLKLVFVTRLFKSAIRPQTRDSWLLHLQRLTAIFESSHHSNISLTILKTAPVLSTRDPLIADMLNNRYSAKVANLLGKFDHLAQPVDLPFFEQMCFNSCEIQPTKSSAHRNYQLLHCAGQKQLTYSHLIKTLAKLPKANTHTQTRTKGKKYQPTHLRSPMSNIAQLAKMTCFHSVALNGYRPLSPTPFKTALAWLKDEITTHNSPNLETHYRYADERAAQDLDSDHAYRYLPHLSNLDYITTIYDNNQNNKPNQTNHEHRLKSLILRIATAP